MVSVMNNMMVLPAVDPEEMLIAVPTLGKDRTPAACPGDSPPGVLLAKASASSGGCWPAPGVETLCFWIKVARALGKTPVSAASLCGQREASWGGDVEREGLGALKAQVRRHFLGFTNESFSDVEGNPEKRACPWWTRLRREAPHPWVLWVLQQGRRETPGWR